MPGTDTITAHDAAGRTRALLRGAAVAFEDGAAAGAWLHAPHPALLGASPAAAAWHSNRLAHFASALLRVDARRRSFPSPHTSQP